MPCLAATWPKVNPQSSSAVEALSRDIVARHGIAARRVVGHSDVAPMRKRDPGEKYGALYAGLFAVTPIQMTMRQHMGRIKEFPHRKPEVAEEAQLTPHD